MENLVILYGGELTCHAFENVFGGKSAFERVLDWAKVVCGRIVLFAKTASPVEKDVSALLAKNAEVNSGIKIEVISKDFWTKADFISSVSESLKKYGAAHAIVSYADTPFLNEKLTRELLDMHTKYAAEYSFADGFPYGLAPEIIEAGTAGILSELSKTSLKAEGEKGMDREAIFSVMRGDINSFEVETLISDEDYRLLRFNFEASSKINFLACKNLYDASQNQKIDLSEPYALSNLAAKTPSVMQSVPAFYNIQISAKYGHAYSYSLSSINKNPAPKDFMDFADFKKILSQIADFSENAVISLSAFGEPLLHPEFLDFAAEVILQNDENHKISLLIETAGTLVTEEIASKIAALASEKNAEVNWILYLDAVEKSSYAKIHACDENDFEKAILSVQLLEKHFPHHVYPQFMRMKANENQLEHFYRFWKEKESPSHGELIIQKYNSVCGVLSDEKPADLSPVNRLPCWHLRRDMTILSDGSVPFCFQRVLEGEKMAGNILKDGIEAVWKSIGAFFEAHLSFVDSCNCGKSGGESADNKCGICDESYTFNF